MSNALKRHVFIISMLFLLISAAFFASPVKSEAAEPTVKLGGVDISSYDDNKWHAYNSKKPTISGWKAGKYKLSADRKTLYIDGITFSGSKRGISSNGALKVVATGTNTFTCTGARGICLENSNAETKHLTLAGAANSVINLKCSNAKSISVNNCNITSGTVNATGALYSEGSINVSGGALKVTGNATAIFNTNIKGGTFSVTGNLETSNNFTGSGGTATIGGRLNSIDNMNITGATVSASKGGIFVGGNLTISNGSLTGTSSTGEEGIYVVGDITATGGNLTGTNTSSASGICLFGNLNISGTANVSGKSASNYGVTAEKNSTISGGKLTATTGNYTSFRTSSVLTVSGGTVEAVNNAVKLSSGGAYSNLDADAINVTGGTITAKANGSAGRAISANKTITISNGTINAVSASTSNNWPTLYAGGDITATGGTLSGTNNSSGEGIYAAENLKISGTANVTGKSSNGIGVYTNNSTIEGGKLTATTGNDSSFFVLSNLNVSGGTVEVNNSAQNIEGASCSNMVADTMNVTGGTVTAKTSGSGGCALSVDRTLTISGGVIKAESTDASNYWGTLDVSGDIIATGGELKGINNSGGYGIQAGNSFQISGTANVSGESKSGDGIEGQTMILDGGTVSGVSHEGEYGNGVFLTKTLKMTDGKLYAKNHSSSYNSAIEINYNENGKNEIAEDIWLSKPVDGFTSIESHGDSASSFYVNEKSGNRAHEVVLQKVTSISVKEYPATQMYTGDYLDPTGLSLYLVFADGSVSEMTYEYSHESLIDFTPSLDQTLTAGPNDIGIKCRTKSTNMTINVKDLTAPSLSGYAGSNYTSLKWNRVDGATGYAIYVKEEGESSFTRAYRTDDISYEEYSLPSGVTRNYYILAYRYATSGDTIYSIKSNTVTLTTKLNPPAANLGEETYDTINISWSAVRDAEQYEIYRRVGAGEFEYFATTDETKFTDENLRTGEAYKYKVRAAIPDKGIYSEFSNILNASPYFTGKTELTVTNPGNYTLEWTPVDGATEYEILRSGSESEECQIIATTAGTTYKDTSADKYSVYYYVVRPVRVIEEDHFYGDDSDKVAGEALEKPAPEPPVVTPPAPPKGEESKDAAFNLLQARSTKVTKKSVKLTWKKIKGASKYIVYANKCGTKNKYKKVLTTTSSSKVFTKVAGKKVKAGTYYKFVVIAYDRSGKKIATSKTIHVATKGGKVGNDKKVVISPKKKSLTLKKGKTVKIKAKAIPQSRKLKVKRHRKIAFESSNKKVASVNSKGVIKGLKKGTCYVYAYTQNGTFAKIKVTVR